MKNPATPLVQANQKAQEKQEHFASHEPIHVDRRNDHCGSLGGGCSCTAAVILSASQAKLVRSTLSPSQAYLLGADQYGRDIWTRLLYGARYSLLIGFLAVLVAMMIGTFVGMIAGFRGGKIDIVLMQVMDVILAFPSLILGIALVALMGATMTNIIAAIAFTSVPAFARCPGCGSDPTRPRIRPGM